jgi:hypothetical protein
MGLALFLGCFSLCLERMILLYLANLVLDDGDGGEEVSMLLICFYFDLYSLFGRKKKRIKL